jgi:aerobic carbon-monoxide dehydrogenase medium subunit
MLIALRGRRHISPFTHHRPETVAETLALRAAPGTSAFMAGGIDLIDWMKHGNAVDRLIRLDGMPGLAEITIEPGLLRIGAMASHAAIAESAVIHAALPYLSRLWRGVANPRVRFAGTIGGNVMAAHPDYDALPALMALGAEAGIATEAGMRRIPIGELAMAGRPLLTDFTIAAPESRRLFNDRTLRPALTLWLGLTVEAGQARSVRVAVGMAHPSPVCVELPLDVPAQTLPKHAVAIVTGIASLLPEAITDGRAGATYRRRMVGVLTRRILAGFGDSP